MDSRPIKLKAHDFLRKNFNLYVRFKHLRAATEHVLENTGEKELTVLEIGVAHGEHAEEILETLPVEKLYLVDSYEGVGGYWKDPSNEKEEALKQAKNRLKPYGDKIEWIQRTSDEAVSEVPEGLDYIYIDGLHTYEQVKRDIENYWPKLVEGGFLAGHDCQIDGVFEAVWEHAQRLGRPPKIRCPSTQYPDWLFHKKEDDSDA